MVEADLPRTGVGRVEPLNRLPLAEFGIYLLNRLIVVAAHVGLGCAGAAGVVADIDLVMVVVDPLLDFIVVSSQHRMNRHLEAQRNKDAVEVEIAAL